MKRVSIIISAILLLASCTGGGVADIPDSPDGPHPVVPETPEIPDKPEEQEGVRDTVIRVVAYNLLETDGRRYEMKMSRCKDAMGKILADCKADVFCFSEIDDYFASNLVSIAQSAGVTGFAWDIQRPNRVESTGLEYYYANGIAYRKDKFSLIGRGMYWYTSAGKLTASSVEASSSHVPKYCTLVWSQLKHIPTGKQFYVISTHFPLSSDGTSSGYKTGGAHLACSKALNAFLQLVPDPCIVGADLNSSSESSDENASGYSLLRQQWTDAYEALLASGKLDPFYATFSGTMSGSSSKYYYDPLTFTKNHPERRYDHVMSHGAGFVPVSYVTLMTGYTYGGKFFCPSDHLPVVVDYSIQ